MEYTISGNFTLPSEGKIYKTPINPNISLRSMTTEEEMQRLSHSERAYKILADIIDRCMIEPCGMSSYDMCIGDFQYLLYMLRVVTYGNEYELLITCPICGTSVTEKIDITQMPVLKYDENIHKYYEFTLPKTKHKIRIKYQTPRMIDDGIIRNKEIQTKFKKAIDNSLQIDLVNIIDTIDGEHMEITQRENFVRTLPMADSQTILQYAQKVSNSIGIDNMLNVHCDNCGLDYNSSFRITNEFFRPTINFGD